MFGGTSFNAFKVVLGLSLCTLGGSMLYLYYTYYKDDDETDTAEKKKIASRNDGSKKRVSIDVVVSTEYIPMILGRGGSNLNVIEQRACVNMSIRDKDPSSKVCHIIGMADNVARARALLVKEMERVSIVTEDLVVPRSASNSIMGRCGETLKEICRTSLAKVTMEPETKDERRVDGTSDNRRIIIHGNRDQVNKARKLIEEKIAEDERLRRVVEEVEQNREPRRSPTSSVSSSMYSSQTSLSSHPLKEKMSATRSNEKPMEVYVSAIATPSKFWIQLIGPQTKKLDDMVQSMTEYYSVAANRTLHEIKAPYLGQIVAAIFKYDSKWYRAEIVAILPSVNSDEILLDLYFVDYGDSEYVALNEVCELRTDFLTLRFQAVECFLANVRTSQNQDAEVTWQPQAIQKFEELTQVASWKKLIARVIAYKKRTPNSDTATNREGSPIPGVELFDADSNIGNILISHGYALPSNEQPEQRSQSPYLSSPENSIYQSMTGSGQNSNRATPTALQNTTAYKRANSDYDQTSSDIDGQIQHEILLHRQNQALSKNKYLIEKERLTQSLSNKNRCAEFLMENGAAD